MLPRRATQGEELVPDPSKFPAFPEGYVPEGTAPHTSGREIENGSTVESERYAPLSHPLTFNTEPW